LLKRQIRSRLRKLPLTARNLAANTLWFARTGLPQRRFVSVPENPSLSWYRQTLIQTVDRFNGGLDGRSGTGAYRGDFNGYFHPTLDRYWRQMPILSSTSIAQSRAIYNNVEAHRAADDNAHFLRAIRLGTDFLLTSFRDAQYGGFFWQVTPEGKVADDTKDAYGNAHSLFALAEAYSITRNLSGLQAALDQLDVIEAYFWDAQFPGGVHTSRSRDFSTISGVNNLNTVIHLFEALLALYDVSADEARKHTADLITLQGNFITEHLYRDQQGYTDRGYLALYYDEAWQPSQIPYSPEARWLNAGYATTGHAIEMAYLLSRAVERGFDPRWLATANKLIRFCLASTIDPISGGMIHEIADYDGQPLVIPPKEYTGWAQIETARTLLHFSVVREENYQAEFRRSEAFYLQHLTDAAYGGVYEALQAGKQFQPTHTNKAHVWHMNYHHSMFLAEVLRLAAIYPERISENPVLSR